MGSGLSSGVWSHQSLDISFNWDESLWKLLAAPSGYGTLADWAAVSLVTTAFYSILYRSVTSGLTLRTEPVSLPVGGAPRGLFYIIYLRYAPCFIQSRCGGRQLPDLVHEQPPPPGGCS